MPADLTEELKDFERDLARVVARFMKLYDRVEKEVRPEAQHAPPLIVRAPAPPPAPTPPKPLQLPGYV